MAGPLTGSGRPGRDYVSQGVGYWPAKDWIITSLSEDTWLPGRNMLAVQNSSSSCSGRSSWLRTTRPSRPTGRMPSRSSSYKTAAGGYLYVGTFNHALTGSSTIWRYLLASSQAPTGTPVAVSTPTRVQGAVVADGHYIFSTSYGRNCHSRLKFMKISTGRSGRSIEIPPMSEGIVNVPRAPRDRRATGSTSTSSRALTSTRVATMRHFRFQHAYLTSLTP